MPATSREVGTVARVTAEVPWSFPSMEGFKSSVSSVGASDVPGRDQTGAVLRDNQWGHVYCLLFQVAPARRLHQCGNVH